MELIPIFVNISKKEVERMTKRQVTSRFTGWYLKNKREILKFIEEKNLPELSQFKAFDLWLFFQAIHLLTEQLPTAEDKDLLLADTEYFLRSMCPVSLECVDGQIICTRREYEDKK
jgi:hypothetical protein